MEPHPVQSKGTNNMNKQKEKLQKMKNNKNIMRELVGGQ